MNGAFRLLVLLAFAACTPVRADVLSVNDALDPTEQYRRLSLVLLIGEGVTPELYDRLQRHYRPELPQAPVDPAALKSPLLRIVDQESMLAGTAHLFRISREHGAEVAGRLRELSEQYPQAVGNAGSSALREDAILVRLAIVDSIDNSDLDADGGLGAAIETYRSRTAVLRDLLEFEDFDRELERMTAEAIASVGSQLDAYQRMFDDEVRDDAFEHHVRTAERPYIGRKPFDYDAARLAEEVMEGVVLSESQPNP
jgi:hypothetical protein